MCDKSQMQPTRQQLEHVIKRNFSGLKDDNLDPMYEFEKNLPRIVAPALDIPPEIQMTQVKVSCMALYLCNSSAIPYYYRCKV